MPIISHSDAKLHKSATNFPKMKKMFAFDRKSAEFIPAPPATGGMRHGQEAIRSKVSYPVRHGQPDWNELSRSFSIRKARATALAFFVFQCFYHSISAISRPAYFTVTERCWRAPNFLSAFMEIVTFNSSRGPM